nr:DUF4363 family protein [Salipaludibacillus sp. CUR1]
MVILISGCTTADFFITEKDERLFTEIAELYEEVEAGDWDEASARVKKIEKTYDERKWKLLMLGAIDTIHDLEMEIELLKENIREEDDTESKLTLQGIRYRLFAIYNL